MMLLLLMMMMMVFDDILKVAGLKWIRVVLHAAGRMLSQNLFVEWWKL